MRFAAVLLILSERVAFPGRRFSGRGLLSGLTGTGRHFLRRSLSDSRGRTLAAQARSWPFNLVNSVATLTGNVVMLRAVLYELGYFAGATLIGAIVGTQSGLRGLSLRALHSM